MESQEHTYMYSNWRLKISGGTIDQSREISNFVWKTKVRKCLDISFVDSCYAWLYLRIYSVHALENLDFIDPYILFLAFSSVKFQVIFHTDSLTSEKIEL